MYPKPCLLIMACIFMYHDLYLCFAIIFDKSMHITSSGVSPTEHLTQYCTACNCVATYPQWESTKLPRNRICGCWNWHSKYSFTEFQLGKSVCSIFLDARKAFDSVPHTILVNKLWSHGLNVYLLRWICDYFVVEISVLFSMVDLNLFLQEYLRRQY